MKKTLRKNERPGPGLRRLLAGAMRSALREAKRRGGPDAEAVHTCRKECKCARALLRLGRAATGEAFDPVETAIRDLAHAFSASRDAVVIGATLRKLGLVTAGEARAVPKAKDGKRKVDWAILGTLAGAVSQVERLDFTGLDGKALLSALKHAHKAMRKQWKKACAAPDPGVLHKLRRKANLCRHQLQALEPLAPKAVRERVTVLAKLVETLGDYHDLEVLREKFKAQSGVGAVIEEALHRRLRKIGKQAEKAFAEGAGRVPPALRQALKRKP